MEKFERLNWPEVTALCVALVCVAAALLAVFSPWPWGKEGPWAAFSAIGTFSAAAIALCFGLRESLLRRADQEQQAKILLRIIKADLRALLPKLRRTYNESLWLVSPLRFDLANSQIVMSLGFFNARGIGMPGTRAVIEQLGSLDKGRGELAAEIWATIPVLTELCAASRVPGAAANSRSEFVGNDIRQCIEMIAHHSKILLGGIDGHPYMVGLEEAAAAYEESMRPENQGQ